MINRYTLINIDYLTSSFNFSGESQVPIYNAFPTRKLPVIALNNSKKITYENWGATSEYSKNNNLPNRLISVSLSKISKSNIYLNQFKTERCLIPCDGFFLWKNYFSKNKTPFYFNCIKEKLIYCVGVRDSFQDFNGEIEISFRRNAHQKPLYSFSCKSFSGERTILVVEICRREVRLIHWSVLSVRREVRLTD